MTPQKIAEWVVIGAICWVIILGLAWLTKAVLF